MNQEKEERILAIDYGLKRIGLALCDPLKIFAYPYKTIENDPLLWTNILAEIQKNCVVEVLLGYPLKENGSKSSSTEFVEKFHEELKTKLNIPVRLWDERYSSELAKSRILESVTSKKKRRDKGLVDRNAASVILQEYLDQIKRP